MEVEHKQLQASLVPPVTEVRHLAIPFLGHKLSQGQEDAAKASGKDSCSQNRPTDITPFSSEGLHMSLNDFIKPQDRFYFSSVIWI